MPAVIASVFLGVLGNFCILCNCLFRCYVDNRQRCRNMCILVPSNTSATHINMEPIDTDALGKLYSLFLINLRCFFLDDYCHLRIKKNDNIGNGAFGAVFRATYKKSPCAVKLLTHHAQEMATRGAMKSTQKIQKSALECFRKECTYLKSLVHRNIVRHLATVIEPNSKLPMLVMELMDCNLKQYLEDRQDNKLSFLYQISLCSDISKGLAFLYSEKIIHRDLCDDNVLLVLKGVTPTAKIGDFGMSRILPQDYMSDTLTGLGHRQVYLPPEAMIDPYDYNYTLDIYSFGVLAAQIVQLKTRIKTKEDLQTIFEDIPDTHLLKNIIRSCLSEDAKSRPQASDIVSQIA